MVLLVTATGVLRRAVASSRGTRTSMMATRATPIRTPHSRSGQYVLLRWKKLLIQPEQEPIAYVYDYLDSLYYATDYPRVSATTDEVTLTKEVLPMLKTKEELEQIIANASAELKALEELNKIEPWAPKGSRWIIAATQEVKNVEAYNFKPIVTEAGLLRDNYGEALKASKDLYTYSRLLAYRDEFDGCTTCLWCLYLIKDNSYDLEQHIYKRLGTVYFTEATARQLLNDIISGKYYL